MTFGWTDILQRYRRSLLGPFWITLSAGAMIGGIGLLYSQLLKQPTADYLPFLAAGLITWFFISAVINEGCSVFIGAEHMIKQVRLPFTVHVLRVVFRNLVILLHNLLVLVPVYLWSGKAVGWGVLLALPAILLRAELAAAGAAPEPGLLDDLRRVNLALWQIEDDIREHERRQDFGAGFIALARSVYRSNDRRAALKARINGLCGSEIVEVKSYSSYD